MDFAKCVIIFNIKIENAEGFNHKHALA